MLLIVFIGVCIIIFACMLDDLRCVCLLRSCCRFKFNAISFVVCLFVCFAVNSFTDSCLPGYEGNPLVPGDYCRTDDGRPPSEGSH